MNISIMFVVKCYCQILPLICIMHFVFVFMHFRCPILFFSYVESLSKLKKLVYYQKSNFSADLSLRCQKLSWEFGMVRHQNTCICLHFSYKCITFVSWRSLNIRSLSHNTVVRFMRSMWMCPCHVLRILRIDIKTNITVAYNRNQ